MQSNEVTVTAVKVKSYRKRNGTWYLAGEIMRDITLATQNATINKFPYFPAALEDIVFCDTSNTYYDFIVADSNLNDTLKVELIGKTPDYQVQYLGQSGVNRSYRVYFNLDSSEWNSRDYYLILQVSDEKCSGTARGLAQHGLKLKSTLDTTIFSRAGLSLERVCNDLNASFSGVPLIYPYLWKINGEEKTKRIQTINLMQDSSYNIQLFYGNSSCHLFLGDTFQADSIYHFDASFSGFPSATCLGQNISGVWTVSGGLDSNYYWIQNQGQDSSSFELLHDSNQYYLKVANAGGCSADTLVLVDTFPELKVNVNTEWSYCSGNSNHFYIPVKASGGQGSYKYTWNNVAGTDSFFVNSDTIGNLILLVNDTSNCFILDSIHIDRRPRPDYRVNGEKLICTNDSFRLEASTHLNDSLVNYDWGFGVVSNKRFRIKPTADTSIVFRMIDTGYCTIIDTLQLRYYAGWKTKFSDTLNICDNASENVDDAFQGIVMKERWFGESTAQFDSVYHIHPDTAGTREIHLYILDSDGCEFKDSFLLHRRNSPDLGLNSIKTTWCENENEINLMDSVVQKYGFWMIDEKPDSVFNPSALQPGDHFLEYSLDSGMCHSRWEKLVRIRSLPQANIILTNAMGQAPLKVDFDVAIWADTTYSFYWDFGAGKTGDSSTVLDPSYTYTSMGYFSPRFHLVTPYCLNQISLDSEVYVTGYVGLNEIAEARVYPNPGNGYYSLESHHPDLTILGIYSASGKMLDAWKSYGSNGNLKLDLTRLPEGIYFLRLHSTDGYQGLIKIIQER
ncbi:MAG: T9SS type A sorting domain-containing protein [Bacteroidetes bacterium]|nr:T9SS type A sorting domain-containing protein [Bacteroidota bacterium]